MSEPLPIPLHLRTLGESSLTPAGKRHIANSMYMKAGAFLQAATLVRSKDGSEHTDWVALHLLCQGIELFLKALLLFGDYDQYIKRLKALGHDISEIAVEASKLYGLKAIRPNLKSELDELSKLYRNHLLRYGSAYDILVDPRSIGRDRVFHRLCAAIRTAGRADLRRKTTSGYGYTGDPNRKGRHSYHASRSFPA